MVAIAAFHRLLTGKWRRRASKRRIQCRVGRWVEDQEHNLQNISLIVVLRGDDQTRESVSARLPR